MTKKLKVLILEPLNTSEDAIELLRSNFDIAENKNDKILYKNIDFIYCKLKNFLSKDYLSKFPNLKAIITPTTGLDHIDIEYCDKASISIISLRGEDKFLEKITPTSELVWGLTFGILRKINISHEDIMRGKWNRDNFKGESLNGKVIGIIGYGRLGKQVANVANAFGMKILINDVRKNANDHRFKFVDLDQLLAESDIITLHIHADKNFHFLDHEKISITKKNPVIINTSRGSIVNEHHIVEALRSNKISGYGTDVLMGESSSENDWLEDNEIYQYAKIDNRILITPHIGGNVRGVDVIVEKFIIEKLIYFSRAL